MEICDKIRKLRIERNFSQRYLAEELGIDISNYGRLESGKQKITIDRLMKIAAVLGVGMGHFFTIEMPTDMINEAIIENKQYMQRLTEDIELIKQFIIHSKIAQ